MARVISHHIFNSFSLNSRNWFKWKFTGNLDILWGGILLHHFSRQPIHHCTSHAKLLLFHPLLLLNFGCCHLLLRGPARVTKVDARLLVDVDVYVSRVSTLKYNKYPEMWATNPNIPSQSELSTPEISSLCSSARYSLVHSPRFSTCSGRCQKCHLCPAQNSGPSPAFSK